MRWPVSGHLRRNWAAYAVLITGVALSLLAGRYLHDKSQGEERRRFEEQIADIRRAIDFRNDAYVEVLLATRGFFAGSEYGVTRDEFRAYVAALEINRLFPGIGGIGFAKLQSDQRFTVEYLEPASAGHVRAVGFELGGVPAARAALERARDSGVVAASSRLAWGQDSGPAAGPPTGATVAFILVAPVYKTPQPATIDTIAERRASITGFVFGVFRSADLFREIFPQRRRQLLHFEVFDGTQTTPEAQLYHDDAEGHPAGPPLRGPGLAHQSQLAVADRQWTLSLVARPALTVDSGGSLAFVALVGGLLVSMLLAGIVRTEIRARTLAQQAIRLRDEFLSVASHELRSPVSTLLLQVEGQLTALRTGVDIASPAEQERRLERTGRQVRRLVRLLDELLDVSRITAGRPLELRREEVDLGAVVSESIRLLDESRTGSRSEISSRVDDGVVGSWDRLRIEQLVTNLLSNALKYGAGKPVEVSVHRQNGVATLSVSDRGVGIAAEDLERIFDRFERAPSGRSYPGMGLGLWIARQIVSAHGGQIRASSELGVGSTFTVTLPPR